MPWVELSPEEQQKDFDEVGALRRPEVAGVEVAAEGSHRSAVPSANTKIDAGMGWTTSPS